TFGMNLLGQTLLPAYCHVQDQNDRLKRILLRVTALLAFLGMPALVFVFFSGTSLLTVIYGPQYVGAAMALILASWVALINLANGQITMVFYAKGRPQLHRACVIIMAIVMLVFTYPFAKELGL